MRMCAKPAASVRTVSFATPVAVAGFNRATNQWVNGTMNRRYFSTQALSGKDICAKIEACGINDAGKEAVIGEEIKKKNFAGLRDAAEEQEFMNSFIVEWF